MSSITKLKRAFETLSTLDLKFCLVGGLAVSARTVERFTKDIDFAIAVDTDQHAEQVGLDMQRAGFELQQVLEQTNRGRIATLRFVTPGAKSEAPDLDLMFASCGIEPEIVAGASHFELSPNLRLPVARTGHLIAMKVLSQSDRRETDRADLRNLFAVATSRDLEIAEKSIELIIQRGFHRDKDLKRDYRFFAASAEY